MLNIHTFALKKYLGALTEILLASSCLVRENWENLYFIYLYLLFFHKTYILCFKYNERERRKRERERERERTRERERE